MDKAASGTSASGLNHRQSRRRKRRLSKLHRYREELEALRREGASYRKLADWLRIRKRRRAHPSTIARYLTSLPVEVQDEIPGLGVDATE